MGKHSAVCLGLDDKMMDEQLLKDGESHPGMMKVIDEATRETHSGKFWNFKGVEEAW